MWNSALCVSAVCVDSCVRRIRLALDRPSDENGKRSRNQTAENKAPVRAKSGAVSAARRSNVCGTGGVGARQCLSVCRLNQ